MSASFVSSMEINPQRIVEFNIQIAETGKEKELKQINDALLFQKELSVGEIYLQKDTNNYWYINETNTIARLIKNKQIELFYEWDKRELLPSDAQFEILSSIGGLPSTQYMMEPKSVRVPASITKRNGEVIDFCIVHFSPAPPFQRYFHDCILLDDVIDINPSKFALSHDLRLSSILADEIRMGFSPFVVRTNKGDLLTYNGTTQFVSDANIKGDEIVCEMPLDYYKIGKLQDIPKERITYVICKWDERVQALFDRDTQALDLKLTARNIKPVRHPKKSFWQKLIKR
ncbi:MAG TPA: hypothetical protein VNW06_04215 [Cytophagaceae bacterium]|jgi:hypothetical protein|nr:hypothetical protein [Cytophagaceae bacterium]